jgi:predicted NBD/HSP70 family sugar kinase
VIYIDSMTSAPPVPARQRTRGEVLAHIRAAGALTRGELVELTGLARSTINHAVGQLLADGSVMESQSETKGPGSGSGRPGTKLRPSHRNHFVAGIDFGHSHVHSAVADGSGKIVAEERVELPVDLRALEALDVAASAILRMQKSHSIERIDAVVAGVPGPLDHRTGLVSSPTILSDWVGLAPVKELERRLRTVVHAENDAFLGAYGELRNGAGRGMDDFLYVKVSHGIGACPVIHGRPYHGASGIAGEIGHTQLMAESELCRCGQRGCLEAVVSIDTVRQQVAHSHPGVDLAGVPLTEIDDPMTQRILDEAGRTLGRVLAAMCNLLNPAAIILGGELGTAGPAMTGGVEASIRRYVAPAVSAAARVIPATLGARAELTGALAMAAELANHASL